MTMVRDIGALDRFPYLASLGLDPADVGRLPVLGQSVSDPGIYVEAASGESQILEEGDSAPDGVWIAQEELDSIKPNGGQTTAAVLGFGEGWGKQGPQLGGDRSYAEEDSGGTRRVAHEGELSETDGEGDLPPG
ncbi:MAG TPA: hypothetical protein VFL82_12595 [Thermomicrobiales bacterium]|nr:hypothetical protein [Thermomicrobiales bacterium]